MAAAPDVSQLAHGSAALTASLTNAGTPGAAVALGWTRPHVDRVSSKRSKVMRLLALRWGLGTETFLLDPRTTFAEVRAMVARAVEDAEDAAAAAGESSEDQSSASESGSSDSAQRAPEPPRRNPARRGRRKASASGHGATQAGDPSADDESPGEDIPATPRGRRRSTGAARQRVRGTRTAAEPPRNGSSPAARAARGDAAAGAEVARPIPPQLFHEDVEEEKAQTTQAYIGALRERVGGLGGVARALDLVGASAQEDARALHARGVAAVNSMADPASPLYLGHEDGWKLVEALLDVRGGNPASVLAGLLLMADYDVPPGERAPRRPRPLAAVFGKKSAAGGAAAGTRAARVPKKRGKKRARGGHPPRSEVERRAAPRRHRTAAPPADAWYSSSDSDGAGGAAADAPAATLGAGWSATWGSGTNPAADAGRVLHQLGANLLLDLPAVPPGRQRDAEKALAALANAAGQRNMETALGIFAEVLAHRLTMPEQPKKPRAGIPSLLDERAGGECTAISAVPLWGGLDLPSSQTRSRHRLVGALLLSDVPGRVRLVFAAHFWELLLDAEGLAGLHGWGMAEGVTAAPFFDVLLAPALQLHAGSFRLCDPGKALLTATARGLAAVAPLTRHTTLAGLSRVVSCVMACTLSVAATHALAVHAPAAAQFRGGSSSWAEAVVAGWQHSVASCALLPTQCGSAAQEAHARTVAVQAQLAELRSMAALATAPTHPHPSATSKPPARPRVVGTKAAAGAGATAAQRPRAPRRFSDRAGATTTFSPGQEVCGICVAPHATLACPLLAERAGMLRARTGPTAPAPAAYIHGLAQRAHATHPGSAPPPPLTTFEAAPLLNAAGKYAGTVTLTPPQAPPAATECPYQMAAALQAAARAAGHPRVFQAGRVAALVRQAGAAHAGDGRDWGVKPAVRFGALADAHREACQSCGNTASRDEAVLRCPVMVVLAQMALEGVRPSTFMGPAPSAAARAEGVRLPRRSATPYPASAADRAILATRHAELSASGAMLPAHAKLPPAGAVAPAFVVTKWVVPPGTDAIPALTAWADASPDELLRWLENPDAPPEAAAAFLRAKTRAVYDFQYVNARTVDIPILFPTVTKFVVDLRPGDWLVVFDIADGFTTVPVAPAEQAWFSTVSPARPGCRAARHRHARVPFGWRAAPAVFCFFSALALHVIAHRWGSVLSAAQVYMDDYGLAITGTAPQDVADAIRAWLDSVGLPVKAEKVAGPARQLVFLGVELSTTGQVEMWLPEPKRQLILWHLSRLLAVDAAGGAIPKRALQAAAGRLQAAASVLPGARTRLAAIYSIQRSMRWQATPASARVTLAGYQRAALRWFVQRLAARCTGAAAVSAWERTPAPLRVRVQAATDAAGSGGIGGWLLADGADSPITFSAWAPGVDAPVPGTRPPEAHGESTLRELQAVAHAAGLAATQARQRGAAAALLEVATDSQAAAALLVKGACTSNAAINGVLEKLDELCTAHSVFIVTRWVPREVNGVADALSHPDRPEEAAAAVEAAGPARSWWAALHAGHTVQPDAQPSLRPRPARAGTPHSTRAPTPAGGRHTTTRPSTQK